MNNDNEEQEPENPDKYWMVRETIQINGVYGKAKIKRWYASSDGKLHQKILSFDKQT